MLIVSKIIKNRHAALFKILTEEIWVKFLPKNKIDIKCESPTTKLLLVDSKQTYDVEFIKIKLLINIFLEKL